MTFYSFVSFNIFTYDSSGIKNKEGVFFSDTDILGGIINPKKQKKKKTAQVVKRRLMIILKVNKRKKASCVFKIFLNIFHSCPLPDYGISMSIFLVPKVHFSQSQTLNVQNFLGKHALEGPKISWP